MASPFTLACYDKINSEMGELLSTGKFVGVNFTAFTSPTATKIATVDGKNVSNKKVAKISCCQPHVDSKTGNNVNGSITVEFDDGSKITAVDNEDSFWYSLAGIAFVPKSFGSSA
jgi:hypothetical protein